MPATKTTETTAAAARPNSPATMRRRTFAQVGSADPECPLRAARALSSLLDSLTRWPASRAHYRNGCLAGRLREAFAGIVRRGCGSVKNRAFRGLFHALRSARLCV